MTLMIPTRMTLLMKTDLVNLPDPVVERLAKTDAEHPSTEVVQRGKRLEARTFSRGELRLDDNGNPVLDGYATVYEYAYDVAGGAERGGWSEVIAEGACTKSVRERDDVRLLLNHEGIPLGRTRSKTLELVSDGIGLRVSSTLDASSPLVQTVTSAMDRGDLDEMSFAFRVIRQEWDSSYMERRILELQLFDVSVVTYPANPAAVAQLRDSVPVETVSPSGLDLRTAKAFRDALI